MPSHGTRCLLPNFRWRLPDKEQDFTSVLGCRVLPKIAPTQRTETSANAKESIPEGGKHIGEAPTRIGFETAALSETRTGRWPHSSIPGPERVANARKSTSTCAAPLLDPRILCCSPTPPSGGPSCCWLPTSKLFLLSTIMGGWNVRLHLIHAQPARNKRHRLLSAVNRINDCADLTIHGSFT